MEIRWPGSKKHLDEQKVKAKAQAELDLQFLLECGDEDQYVAMLKAINPKIKPEELVSLVNHFRTVRRNRSRGV